MFIFSAVQYSKGLVNTDSHPPILRAGHGAAGSVPPLGSRGQAMTSLLTGPPSPLPGGARGRGTAKPGVSHSQGLRPESPGKGFSLWGCDSGLFLHQNPTVCKDVPPREHSVEGRDTEEGLGKVRLRKYGAFGE